jgi:DNA-binding protein HU-beta
MTKNDIVDVISAKTGYTKEVVSAVLDETNQVIIRALKKGDSVKISGFGTFYPVDRKARKGRNPKTGQVIEIPSRKVTRFRSGKNTKVLT